MLGTPVCTEQIKRVYGCLVTKPETAFECDDDGMAAVKDGHCDREQGQFVKCLQAAALNQR
jgi:hypothetical protein